MILENKGKRQSQFSVQECASGISSLAMTLALGPKVFKVLEKMDYQTLEKQLKIQASLVLLTAKFSLLNNFD